MHVVDGRFKIIQGLRPATYAIELNRYHRRPFPLSEASGAESIW